MMIRILFFCTVLVSAVTGPVWLFAALVIGYVCRYTGYEILFIAAGIDAYFGAGQPPYYLLTIGAAMMLVELVRPFIRTSERVL